MNVANCHASALKIDLPQHQSRNMDQVTENGENGWNVLLPLSTFVKIAQTKPNQAKICTLLRLYL